MEMKINYFKPVNPDSERQLQYIVSHMHILVCNCEIHLHKKVNMSKGQETRKRPM